MAPRKGNAPWNKGTKKTHPCAVCGNPTGMNYACCSRECSYKNPARSENIRTSQLALTYPEQTCDGCGKSFEPHNFRQKFCETCRVDGPLRTWMQRYKISGLEVKRLFEENDGKCALCPRKAKYIDHDHVSGKIRGALCPMCNNAIGRLEEFGWIEKANEYIKKA